jgi:hypothetical protein
VETVEGEFTPGWFCHHRLLPWGLVIPVCEDIEREVSQWTNLSYSGRSYNGSRGPRTAMTRVIPVTPGFNDPLPPATPEGPQAEACRSLPVAEIRDLVAMCV